MSGEKLYPEVPDDHPYMIDTRIKNINDKTNNLRKDIDKYKKLKSRWNSAYTAIKCVSLSLVVGGTIVGICTSSFGLATPVLILVGSCLTGGSSVLTELIAIGYIKPQISKYRNRYQNLTDKLNRVFIFTEKCKKDKMISLEEMKNFDKLMYEQDNTVNNEYDGFSKNDVKKALKNVDKIMKETRMQKLEERILDSIHSKNTGIQ